MKILLLGGTGILSTDFTTKTLDEENEVWILNRGKRTGFIDKRAKLIVADLRKETVEQLKKKIHDVRFDVIVDYLSFEPSHIEKIMKVFKDKFTQYIFISSATAYKNSGSEIISESLTQIGNDKWSYSYNKYLCELYLRDLNINFTIIRPYVTYGKSRLPFQIIPDNYHFTLISRIKNNKPVALLNNGEAICTLTNTVDFANILYMLLLNPKSYKEDFHITSHFQQSWKDVYEMYCELLGCESTLVSVSPQDILKYMPEYFDILMGDKGISWKFDNSKVLDAIGGYDFKIDLREGLSRSIEFYENNSFMQGIDYKWEGRMDYMIKRIIHYPKLNIIKSSNSNSNSKIFYYLLRVPITHYIYMKLRKIKNGRK